MMKTGDVLDHAQDDSDKTTVDRVDAFAQLTETAHRIHCKPYVSFKQKNEHFHCCVQMASRTGRGVAKTKSRAKTLAALDWNSIFASGPHDKLVSRGIDFRHCALEKKSQNLARLKRPQRIDRLQRMPRRVQNARTARANTRQSENTINTRDATDDSQTTIDSQKKLYFAARIVAPPAYSLPQPVAFAVQNQNDHSSHSKLKTHLNSHEAEQECAALQRQQPANNQVCYGESLSGSGFFDSNVDSNQSVATTSASATSATSASSASTDCELSDHSKVQRLIETLELEKRQRELRELYANSRWPEGTCFYLDIENRPKDIDPLIVESEGFIPIHVFFASKWPSIGHVREKYGHHANIYFHEINSGVNSAADILLITTVTLLIQANPRSHHIVVGGDYIYYAFLDCARVHWPNTSILLVPRWNQ